MPNPYVGPHPFEAGQPIFGRAREIEELYYLLSAERIVLLHSPSGAGKSSLIQAGLLGRVAHTFDAWGPVRVHAPGPSNRYVRSVIAGLEFQIPEARRRPAEEIGAMTLAEYAEKRPRRRSAPANVLLIFDQFEEVLTADPLAVDAKREFFRQLGELLQDPHYWALFSLREDYLAPLDPYAKLVPTHLKNRFRLDLLDCDGAREAIAKPAEFGGRGFTEEALNKLVLDLATIKVQQPDGSFRDETGQHVEPVQLQVVCQDLWEKTEERKRPSIDADDITECGDVKEALALYYAKQVEKIAGGSMEQIAAQFGAHASEMTEKLARIRAMMPGENASGDLATAVQNLNTLMAEHKPLLEQNKTLLTQRVKRENAIREWMDGKLITADGVRSQVLRGVGSSEGLENALIEGLVNCHLVRREQRMGAVWYELAHDRLIEPVRSNNESWWAKQAPLLRAARRWAKNGRDPRYLYLGEQLKEVKTGLDKDSTEPIVSVFLEQCDAAEEDRQYKEAGERKTRRLVTLLAMILGASAPVQVLVFTMTIGTFGVYGNEGLAEYIGSIVVGALVAAGILQASRWRGRITELLRKLTRKHRMDSSLQGWAEAAHVTPSNTNSGSTNRDGKFDPWETRTLQFTPLWTFLAVAGADGRLGRKEARALVSGVRRAASTAPLCFQPIFAAIRSQREAVLKEFLEDTRTTVQGLADVAAILGAKVSPEESSSYKVIVVDLARRIAKKSGAAKPEVAGAVDLVEKALEGKPVPATRVRYYRHSGLYSVSGVVQSILAGALMGFAVAWPYYYVQDFIGMLLRKSGGIVAFGLLIVMAFIAGIYGLAVGLAIDKFIGRTKVRNPAAVNTAAVSGTIVALPMLALWRLNVLKGVDVWIAVIELAVIGTAAILSARMSLSSMFCEKCGSWCKYAGTILHLSVFNRDELRQRLEAGEIEFLSDAITPEKQATALSEWLTLVHWSCEQCRDVHAVAVKHITAKIDKKGNRDLSEAVWIDRLMLTARMARWLFGANRERQ